MSCCLSNICTPTSSVSCCPWWCNLAPAITTLAISVIAIVLVFVYKKNRYYSIPPGVCVLTSAHFVCLSVNTKQLKSFAQNNEKLSLETKNLQGTTAHLMKITNEQEMNLAATKVEVETLTRNNEQHAQLVAKQKQQLCALQDTIEKQKKSIYEQEQRNKALYELNEMQLTVYQKIASSFGQHNEDFTKQLKQFSETAHSLEDSRSKQEEIVVRLSSLHDLLFNDLEIQRRQVEISNCQKSLEQLNEAILKKKQEIEELNIRLGTLKEINQQLAATVNIFEKHVNSLIQNKNKSN